MLGALRRAGPCQGLGRRSYTYFKWGQSKWKNRLSLLLEKSRRPKAPEIPEFASYPESEIKPVNPVLGSRRSGLLAYKMGCISLYDEWGQRVFCTVAMVDRCKVLEQKTLAKDGYQALRLACGYKTVKRFTKNELGKFIKAVSARSTTMRNSALRRIACCRSATSFRSATSSRASGVSCRA
jgi:large subunit ribosomal protein L3